jgi:S1-C subfamily serine protease
VGVLGAGHVTDRFGVPRQLEALGVQDVAVLLPWEHAEDCEALRADVADAVFGLDATPEAPGRKPRLGVRISRDEGGVRVLEVMQDSVAAAARIEKDDVIFEAAGSAVAETGDLIAVVQRQAPGTWLPLKLRRAGESLEIIAKFPSGT